MSKPKGWRGESARHAEAARGHKTGCKSSCGTPKYKSLKTKKPKMVSIAEAEKWGRMEEVAVYLPWTQWYSDEELNKEFQKRYGLDFGYDPEDEDGYEKLFYNNDLRSFCGFRWEEDMFVMLPRYWAGGKEYGSDEWKLSRYYGDNWRKMLADAERIEDPKKGLKHR
jgi:hypothetical protein